MTCTFKKATKQIFDGRWKLLIVVVCWEVYFPSNGDAVHVYFDKWASLASLLCLVTSFIVLLLRGLLRWAAICEISPEGPYWRPTNHWKNSASTLNLSEFELNKFPVLLFLSLYGKKRKSNHCCVTKLKYPKYVYASQVM